MRWQLVCALVAVAQLPSRGRAAFEGCDDAFNYAHNSGRLIVGQAFARLGCDPAKLPAVHTALLRAVELQVLRTSDSDPEKLCFYGGLWAGVSEQLGQEYPRCAGAPAFACVPRELLASYAARTLRALVRALAAPEQVSPAELEALFSDAGAARCAPDDPAVCAAALCAGMDAAALAAFAEQIEPLSLLLCGPGGPAPL